MEDRILYSPERLYMEERDGVFLIIDPEFPNWLSTNAVGADIIRQCDGRRTLRDVVGKVARRWGRDYGDVLGDAKGFIHGLMEKGMASSYPFLKPPYPGRSETITPRRLDEVWIYTNNHCNLSCIHCLVSAGPYVRRDYLTLKEIKRVIDEVVSLGARRLYLTGGEPFLRDDIFEILEYASLKTDTIILTNGTLLTQERLKGVERFKGRVIFQVSLEGPNPDVNDSIRGRGNFELTVKGIRGLLSIGINPIVTTTITQFNQHAIVDTTRFLDSLGIRYHHILWLHARGRTRGDTRLLVSSQGLIDIMRELREVTRGLNITVDNEVSLSTRVRAKRGRKNDLCNCCFDMLSIDADGGVYPCGALTGERRFFCGSIKIGGGGRKIGNLSWSGVGDIWLKSRVMEEVRDLTVQKKVGCNNCYLKFICGGGCFCQAYYGQEIKGGVGSPLAEDPYCDTYKTLFNDLLWEYARRGLNGNAPKDGHYHPPTIFNAMEDSLPSCTAQGVAIRDGAFEVGGFHCSCVLAVDAERQPQASSLKSQEKEILCHDPIRDSVKGFYAEAARKPMQELCCPISYDDNDISHIPEDVLGISYGCGSPISIAEIKEGESVLDLGSGAGIDCFIAAKKVGSKGRVIGVDMTEEMLDRAREASKKVAKNLGFDVVEFRKGFLEEIPLADEAVDLVTSNCVINLSPDKERVFREMYRVLKHNGRFTISDIVADKDVPAQLKADKRLWGECISGALKEDEFIAIARGVGFYGIDIAKRYLYREINGIRFYSITVKGYKFKKGPKCVYIGQYAIYHGPFKSVWDDDGHEYPVGVPVEVCTDTAEKLSRPPYRGLFTITDPLGTDLESIPRDEARGCGPECC